MKVAIIEDEKLTAKDLARTICAVAPEAEIVAMIHSMEAGLAYMSAKPQLDLIFSDIHLGDGLSFQIFEATDCRTPIIFCTAYDDYALRAFRTFGVDYLLKPFSRAAVEKSLEKFMAITSRVPRPAADYPALLLELGHRLLPSKLPAVIIHQADRIIPLAGAQIALFAIDDSHVYAYTFDGKRHLLSQKLDILEQQFSPYFFRANRQHLISRKAVRDAAHFAHRKLVVNLTIPFPEDILVGKLKAAAFVDWLSAY